MSLIKIPLSTYHYDIFKSNEEITPAGYCATDLKSRKEYKDLDKEIAKHERAGYTFNIHKEHIQFSGRPQQSRGWPYY